MITVELEIFSGFRFCKIRDLIELNTNLMHCDIQILCNLKFKYSCCEIQIHSDITKWQKTDINILQNVFILQFILQLVSKESA